ncbi:glycerate kinase family protein [Xylanibacter muris]|uniref:Glycerate kinase n=1 Tax=Xylanibacter muris TaxID=2736290 RepID=A0ABX2AIZ4_9BACT|nr:glycerate kinase [Xylanibacter muris]NPD90924.1 glycerate kinase [Xylanibacter muris]
MKYILAIDSFKGCLTSSEAEDTVAEALNIKSNSTEAENAEIIRIPVSDGGDGMLDAFVAAMNGKKEKAEVHDPLMRKITAEYGITGDGTAIIETARACGLTLMSEKERNPLKATSYGVGELIAYAIRKGCRKFIIGLGGSGTNDTGTGMLKALENCFGRNMQERGIPEQCRFIIASDVDNPLLGPNGAAYVYGPQKGATPEMIHILERRAREFADKSSAILRHDCRNTPGAGAAGGLGYALMQYLNAQIHSGADLLLDTLGFDIIAETADVVITGEGSADRQTLMGKLPGRILKRCKDMNIPVWLIAGRINDRQQLAQAGFSRLICITPEDQSIEEAVMADTAKRNIMTAIMAV